MHGNASRCLFIKPLFVCYYVFERQPTLIWAVQIHLYCHYKRSVVALQSACSPATSGLVVIRSWDVGRKFINLQLQGFTRVRDKIQSLFLLSHITSWQDSHFFTCPILFRGHAFLSQTRQLVIPWFAFSSFRKCAC